MKTTFGLSVCLEACASVTVFVSISVSDVGLHEVRVKPNRISKGELQTFKKFLMANVLSRLFAAF